MKSRLPQFSLLAAAYRATPRLGMGMQAVMMLYAVAHLAGEHGVTVSTLQDILGANRFTVIDSLKNLRDLGYLVDTTGQKSRGSTFVSQWILTDSARDLLHDIELDTTRLIRSLTDPA